MALQADADYNPIGFGSQHGYYTDTGTGLLCLTHRYYDPGTGRFVNRDPIGYGGGINLYGFAGNNPVNESDPSGFDPKIKGDPDDPTGLPRDDEGQWHGSTMNPAAQDGTHEARRANAMRRSLGSVLFGAILAVVSPEGKVLEAAEEALTAARAARLARAGSSSVRLLNPPIIQTIKGLQHTIDRHTYSGIAKWAGRSKFNAGENVSELVSSGTQQLMQQQKNGNYARTYDVGRTIGIDRNMGGRPTSVMTVITRANGELVTAFPGRP